MASSFLIPGQPIERAQAPARTERVSWRSFAVVSPLFCTVVIINTFLSFSLRHGFRDAVEEARDIFFTKDSALPWE